eukprot:UN26876
MVKLNLKPGKKILCIILNNILVNYGYINFIHIRNEYQISIKRNVNPTDYIYKKKLIKWIFFQDV